MRKFVIATHGLMADGMKDSIAFISGIKDSIQAISFFTQDLNYPQVVAEVFKDKKDEDEIIIFTDIFYGSVCQQFMPYLGLSNVHMISGVNLPLILEIVMTSGDLNADILRNIIISSREQLAYVDPLPLDTTTSNDIF